MKTSLSILFKTTREKIGISQEKMAAKLGCSRVSLSHYERGKMIPGGDKVEKLLEIAKRLSAA